MSGEELTAAMAETEALLKANRARSPSDPTLPVFRCAAALRLEHERFRFEAGDRMALLGAIRICANHDIPIPAWAASAFIAAYDEVLNCRKGSWDAAFGKPYKGKHLGKLSQRRRLRFAVFNEINRRLKQDTNQAVDVGLFEDVGADFGIGATLCGELYYSAKRQFPATK